MPSGTTCHSRSTHVSPTWRLSLQVSVTMPYYSIDMVKDYTIISNAKIPCSISKMLKLVHANKSRLKVIIFKKGRETSNNKNL